MCGIAGLFIGCALEAVCPKRLLASDLAAPAPQEPYKSKFDDWYERSTVRNGPRRMVLKDEKGLFFSPDFIPIMKHPLIAEQSEEIQRKIMVQQLYRYLDFTAKLEHVVVNRVAMSIANGYLDFNLPRAMVFDAYKIYCDEAYHALFSADLLMQVEDITGIRAVTQQLQPYFIRRLHQLQHQYSESHMQELVEIFFVIISETLISGFLSDIPAAKDVKASVRAVIRDHAIDEGKHHVYFADFLRRIWPQLHPRYRKEISKLLPSLIYAFLSPDTDSIRVELTSYGIPRDQVEQVVAETFTTEIVSSHIANSISSLTRYLRELGILDDPEVQDKFCEAGLLKNADLALV